MSEKRYNGWTNYETWNVNLWIDNDQGSQEYWQDQAQEAWDDAEADKTFTREENAVLALADQLKNHFEDESCELLKSVKAQASMWADLLGAALSEVNWHEIAEHMVYEVDKTESASDDE